MVKVLVDGLEVEVEPSSTILEAAKKAGLKIPTLCYFPGLFVEATCRVCVVELSGTGRLVPSCAFPVSDRLSVETDNAWVREVRRIALEMILAAHRILCQSCLRKGACKLFELCREYGVEGIPVCAECPLHRDDCLLARGEVCLGPLTNAGCGGVCIRGGKICEGCRGPLTSKDTIREAAKLYAKYGIGLDMVLSRLSMYNSSHPSYDGIAKLLSMQSEEDEYR
ncbi:MAG: 2Fe-2S iron-sulfur cluster-binding protein [Candidatus Bathyarchaeia archaeon]